MKWHAHAQKSPKYGTAQTLSVPATMLHFAAYLYPPLLHDLNFEFISIPMNAPELDVLQQNFLRAFEGNEEKYPRNLEASFPGVFKKIVTLWGSPEIDDCLSHILLDTRGGRAGFPEEVMTEIFNLQGIHDRLFPDHEVRAACIYTLRGHGLRINPSSGGCGFCVASHPARRG